MSEPLLVRRTTDRILALGGSPLDLESMRSTARVRAGNYLRQHRDTGRLLATDDTLDTIARVMGLLTSQLAADLACVLVERGRHTR